MLLEIGQPLHAFDYHFLAGQKIVVRRAQPGETMTTLDEQERVLTDDDLLICDGEKPVALAGIMGGLNSLVTDETVDVFIESAYFEPTGIRRTSKRLGAGLGVEPPVRTRDGYRQYGAGGASRGAADGRVGRRRGGRRVYRRVSAAGRAGCGWRWRRNGSTG